MPAPPQDVGGDPLAAEEGMVAGGPRRLPEGLLRVGLARTHGRYVPAPAEDLHALPPPGLAAVLAGDLDQKTRARLAPPVVAQRPADLRPVGVVDDQEGALREVRLDEPERIQLRPVVVRGVVVVDTDLPAGERPAAQEGEGVALQDRVAREAVAPEVRLEQGAAPALHREVVDPHEVPRVPEHRGDQALPLEGADLDVALAPAEEGGGEVQEGEVVLAGEPADLGEDRREAAVTRVRRARVVVEEPGQSAREPLGIHRLRRSPAGRRRHHGLAPQPTGLRARSWTGSRAGSGAPRGSG